MNKLSSIVVAVFIATWTAKWKDGVGCPEVMNIDPYTGSISPSNNMVLSVVRYCEKINDMKKEFDSLESAREFFRECPEGVCNNIKIEKREVIEGEQKL